ncbi:MAG TPA: FAD-dependent oxidoreductase [Candidatus Anoxymicrobiaceae bacterium]
MPYFISGVTADHTNLIARTPDEFKSMNDIDVLPRHRVTSIDPDEHTVTVRDLTFGRDRVEPYTRLLLSTGAEAFVPPVEGTGLEGVFTLRRLGDSLRIKRYLADARPRRVVIVGAGPIGMEMCESFSTLGLEVTVIDMAGQVVPYMSPEMAARVQARIEEEGVNCILEQSISSIQGKSDGTVGGVVTGSGEIKADLVLLAIGVRPVSKIASDAGIELGAKGAIKVDAHMRTNRQDIYSAGDCATTSHIITGRQVWLPLGSTSRKQGRAAADNMFGGDAEFGGVQGTGILKCFDLTVGRTGLDEAQAIEAGFSPVAISMEAESLHEYYPEGGIILLKLLADGRSGRLLGAELVGQMRSVAEKRLDILSVAITAGMTADDLQYLDLAYAPPYSTAIDIPVIAGNIMSGKIRGGECGCGPQGLD